MKADFTKPIFNHSHNAGDEHMILDATKGFFCTRCADQCMIVPVKILPEWIKLGKRKIPQTEIIKPGDIPTC